LTKKNHYSNIKIRGSDTNEKNNKFFYNSYNYV